MKHALKDLALFALVGFLIVGVACATTSTVRHKAVIASTAVQTGIDALHQSEVILYGAGKITEEQHKILNQKMVPLVKAGMAFNKAITAWPADQPAPPELATLVTAISEFSQAVIAEVPDSPAKSQLMEKIVIIQNAALAILPFLTGGAQ